MLERLPPGWARELKAEADRPYWRELSAFLEAERARGKVIYPAADRIFHALEQVDLPQVRVVILGQDPYHGEGQALGLSFAVPNTLKKKPPSLLNILKEIRSDLGVEIAPEASDLSGWVEQGVLLLNTVLTVEASQPLSHQGRGWEPFTDRVIEALNARAASVLFILWGAHAQKKRTMIDLKRHAILETPHPSPLSAHRGFLGSRVFSRANEILVDRFRVPAIQWGRISRGLSRL